MSEDPRPICWYCKKRIKKGEPMVTDLFGERFAHQSCDEEGAV